MNWTLVTGGAKNLGAEICRTLAAQGHSIVVQYRYSESEAQAVAQSCRDLGVEAEIIQGDFSSIETTVLFIVNYLARFRETKYLVNNVGNYFIGTALQTPLLKWGELFQNNVHVPFALIQALAPSIKKNQGSIVNIGVAGLAHGRADIYTTGYSCAKEALCLLTKSLAKELAPAHVTVNMVSPGYLESSVDLPKDVSALPMQRPGSLTETAQLVAYLLSPAASYITGQNIETAGGLRL